MIRKRAFSVFYMFALTLVFCSLVSGIQTLNEDRIKINEQIKLRRIILDVLGIELAAGTPSERVEELFHERVRTREGPDKTIYVCYDEDKRTISGYAFPVFGPGFWGPIYGMVGVGPDLEEMIGIAFYEHSETPGLGGEITKPFFRDQFSGRTLALVEGKYFDFLPPGTARAPNEVDAITGATETSRRVEIFLNEKMKETLAWLKEQKEVD